MIRTDLHIHTTYCDGADAPETIVRAAIARGMDCIGFSAHSYTFFDESYCMRKADIPRYRAEIAALREKYAGQIAIRCGIEQDYYSAEPTDGYDYVIGSVHYLCRNGVYLPVDETPELLRDAADRWFGGDFYALAEAYYDTVADVADKTGADIIGHFDLIAKFNEGDRLFSPAHPRYRAAWQRAADRLLAAGKPFELNTGAIARGCRTVPYPDADIRQYLLAHGGRLLLSSDSHTADALCFAFDRWEASLTRAE